MKLEIKAKSLTGKLTVPGDKSISHRSIMFGAISHGQTRVKHILRAEDVTATMQAFQDLGVKIEDKEGIIYIQGKGFEGLQPANKPLDMGNSGTSMRLMSGILAGLDFETKLIGDASLSRRPMDRIAHPLKLMGANLWSRRSLSATFRNSRETTAVYQLSTACSLCTSKISFDFCRTTNKE